MFVEAIPGLVGLVFGHVFAFFGSSVPAVAFLVIDPRFGIYPDFSIAPARGLGGLGFGSRFLG